MNNLSIIDEIYDIYYDPNASQKKVLKFLYNSAHFGVFENNFGFRGEKSLPERTSPH